MSSAPIAETSPAAETGASTAPSELPAVEVTGLQKSYRGHRHQAPVVALKGVDITVHPGEFLVLLGPSGCGKTTTLRSIAGLETPDAGRIEVSGRTVYDGQQGINLPPERRRLGMVFQSYALWPHLTVARNIAFPLRSKKDLKRGEIDERVDDILTRMSIAGLGHRYPAELSGGQQQRVSLARALVENPAVVLFDEPLSSVDAAVRRDLRAELRELKERNNFAGVYVTHDQDEAMELGDTVAVMGSGTVLQLDTPRNLYERPQSVGVGTLVGRMNVLPAELVVDGDAAVARSVLGAVPVTLETASSAGEGRLGIRPEDVVLSAAPTPRSVEATVRTTLFLGAHLDVVLEVGGTPIVASPSREGPVYQPGQSVWIDTARSRVRWVSA